MNSKETTDKKYKLKYSAQELENKLDKVNQEYSLEEKEKLNDLKNYDDSQIKSDINTLSEDKLDKNQGSENSGKVLGTNANGEVIPINGYGFEYDEETKMLKYGTDPTSNLNQGIGLDDTLSKTGYAADAGAVGELKEDLTDLDKRQYSESAPIIHDWKDELLSYVNGDIPDSYVGKGIAFTDERFYLTESIVSIVVPDGLKVVFSFYGSENISGFQTGTEKTGTFDLSAYGYKYVRFCVRKTNNRELTIDDARSVVILSLNQYKKKISISEIANDSYNEFLNSGIGYFVPQLKTGRITSTGLVESRGARYYDAYIDTDRITLITVPTGFYVTVYYYDESYAYKDIATYKDDFAPVKKYPYCMIMLHKSDFKGFNDNIEILDSFRVYVGKFDASRLGDICPKFASGYTVTNGGITYNSDGDGITISGTSSSGGSYTNIYYNENALPYGMKAGRKYYLEFNGLPSRVNITIYHKNEIGWQTTDRLVPLTYKQAYFTIPSDAVGLRISLSINAGFTFNERLVPRIYDCESLSYTQRVRKKDCKSMLTIIYDDGLKLFKEYIIPIIRNKKVPIATSIITSSIEAGNERVMTYAEIKECYENGAEILVHSKERTESEWGTDSDAIAWELRKNKHLLNSNGCPVSDCYIYSAQSSLYPSCRHAVEKEFAVGVNSGSQSSKSANDGKTNYYGMIDKYYVERRWADCNWASGETNGEEILKGWIDELASSTTGWQIWTRHNYSGEDEEAYAQTLSNVIDYALEKGINIVTMEKGMREYGLIN